MNLKLVLDYSLGRGSSAAYLDALSHGVALAAWCPHCNRTTFPPERHCRDQHQGEGDAALGQRQLAGHARIVIRTDGPSGSYALAQFDGADNQTVCRIANPQETGAHAKIQATGENNPGIVVEVLGEDIEKNG